MPRLPRGRATRFAFVATALVALAALAGAALAAPSWLTPQPLPVTVMDIGEGVPIAGDGAGDLVVLWIETGTGQTHIRAAFRPPGGPATVFPGFLDGPGSSNQVQKPIVVMDGGGNAVAAWVLCNPTCNVYASFLPRGGAWSSPQQITTDGTDFLADLAINAGGTAAILVGEADGSVKAALRAPGGTFGPLLTVPLPSTVTPADTFRPTNIAVAPNGDVTALYVDHNTGPTPPPDVVYASTRVAGSGAFGAPPQPISSVPSGSIVAGGPVSPRPGGVALAYDASGNSIAVWTEQISNNPPTDPRGGAVRSALLLASNHQWQAQQTIKTYAPATGHQLPNSVGVGFDGSGTATAAWELDLNPANVPTANTESDVQAATRAAGTGSTWSSSATISPTGTGANSSQVTVRGFPSGGAVAVWSFGQPPSASTVGATHGAGGPWSPFVTIGPNGSFGTSTAVDNFGDAVVGLVITDAGGHIHPAIAPYDGAGPQLNGLTVAPSGVAGVPLSFGAAPVDLWSPVAGVSWNFGDGSTANGGSVSHTYGAAGNYTVTVSSSDALGNTTIATRLVQIAPAPVPQVSIKTTRFRVKWKQSVGKGTLALAGTDSQAGTLRVTVSRAASGKKRVQAATIARSLKVGTGAWKLTIKLTRPLPGHYVVTARGTNAGGHSGPTTTRRATLAAPKEGVASDAWISGLAHGPRALALTGRITIVYVTFKLAALPSRKLHLTTTWYQPGGRQFVPPIAKPRASTVVGFVRAAPGRLLPKGVWHVVLRAGKIVVKNLSLRIR